MLFEEPNVFICFTSFLFNGHQYNLLWHLSFYSIFGDLYSEGGGEELEKVEKEENGGRDILKRKEEKETGPEREKIIILYIQSTEDLAKMSLDPDTIVLSLCV